MKKLIIGSILVMLLLASVSCNSRQIDSDEMQIEAVIEGELVLVSGYLRVESTRTNDSYLLVWPEGYSWHMDGREVFIDDADGQTVTGVGDIIAISGKETTAAMAEQYLGETLDAQAKGPYWLVEKVVTRSPRPYISRDEVISIASEIVPPEIIARARTMASLMTELGPNGVWQVQFLRANTARAELGWQEEDKTKFGPEEVYWNLIITIDAKTGEIISREATSGFLKGGPIFIGPLYPEYVPKGE